MKRAQNSDSKTHMKKQNPTSRTEISRKSLKYLFLETPCSEIERSGRITSVIYTLQKLRNFGQKI